MKVALLLWLVLVSAACSHASSSGPPPGAPVRETTARPAAPARPGDDPSQRACTVHGTYRGEQLKAHVAQADSMVRRGFLKLRATLEGRRVVYRGGMLPQTAGTIDDKGGTFSLDGEAHPLSPITSETTSIDLDGAQIEVASRGCSREQIAFGAVHLAAVYFAHRETNQSLR